MVKKRNSIWDILAWIVLAYIFVWLILKVTGVINTPLWLTYSPVFGAVYMAGWYAKKIEHMSGNIDAIAGEFSRFRKETVSEIHEIKLNCTGKHGK